MNLQILNSVTQTKEKWQAELLYISAYFYDFKPERSVVTCYSKAFN